MWTTALSSRNVLPQKKKELIRNPVYPSGLGGSHKRQKPCMEKWGPILGSGTNTHRSEIVHRRSELLIDSLRGSVWRRCFQSEV